MEPIDRKAITALRTLSIDAIEAASSGHPGFPLGAAPLMYAIWKEFLNYDPACPRWEGRDRFVLSAGHGSALYYAMLHLSGFDLSMEELKKFRQWNSKTPGHPEYGHTAGVEATTGPLGHGFATGIGMAIAEKMLAAQYNRPGFEIVSHYVYGIVSDGDMMEGVAAEAASLAGALGLGKVIYLYDDNKITIEGSTEIVFTEDVRARFEAYGWDVRQVGDAEDIGALALAIRKARETADKPSLIMVRTHIGFASPKQDTPAAHGEPLGAENAARTKEKLGVPGERPFTAPAEVKEYFAEKSKVMARKRAQWEALFSAYEKEYGALAKELAERWKSGFRVESGDLSGIFADIKQTSTREASGLILQKLSALVPSLCGGSADLAPSNKTYVNGAGDFSRADPAGRNIHFGVREQAMAAIANGMALHGGFVPYCATFLVFADFMRPAVRLAALMGVHVIFVFTHDSIAVGEDGPTHQPVEQTMSLRIIPGLLVLRPADALETAEAWRVAINGRKPAALVLTRQKVPVLGAFSDAIKAGAEKGGYVISAESASPLDITLVAAGSEVALVLAAQKELAGLGINARVVSLCSWELFDSQSEEYRARTIPKSAPALAVEAGVPHGWEKYAVRPENILALDRFGQSAPGGEVYEKLGFSVANVVDKARRIIGA
ncbi:MAG: transketolase [Acidaminococcales bacterium]|nr:transketolase [Acidaminococcales bacterium]